MSAHSNNGATNNLIAEDSFSGAIKSFQRFAGINETGKYIYIYHHHHHHLHLHRHLSFHWKRLVI